VATTNMMPKMPIFVYSALAGLIASEVVPPNVDFFSTVVEKGGASMLSAAIIWWLLNRFSRQQDRLSDIAERQTVAITELRDATRELATSLSKRPCMLGEEKEKK